MKTMKRIVSFMLAVVLTLGLATTALAAESSYEPTKLEKATAIADVLYKAGLFAGIGKDANGKPIYDLESNATRVQAIVMLVRILNKTAEAETAPTSPFVDVPAWGAPSVNYAYANGLTAGTSKTTFSSNGLVTNTQYITFCLRALGYDSDDFEWNKAHEFAYKLGALTKGEYDNANAPCSRADMVIITYAILNAKMKGSDKTLAEDIKVTLDKPVMPEKPSIPDFLDEYFEVADTNDPANYWNAWNKKTGKYDGPTCFDFKLDGRTILGNIASQYDTSISVKENLERFCNLVNELNAYGGGKEWNCKVEDDKYVSYDRKYANHDISYIRASFVKGDFRNAVPILYYDHVTETFRIGLITQNMWNKEGSHSDARFNTPILAEVLQVLAFFDEDLARQVWALMNDYYMRSDAYVHREYYGKDEDFEYEKMVLEYEGYCGPITKEMVERYGLTYINGGLEPGEIEPWTMNGKTVGEIMALTGGDYNPLGSSWVVVSNGKYTIRIEYDMPNYGFSGLRFTWSLDPNRIPTDMD